MGRQCGVSGKTPGPLVDGVPVCFSLCALWTDGQKPRTTFCKRQHRSTILHSQHGWPGGEVQCGTCYLVLHGTSAIAKPPTCSNRIKRPTAPLARFAFRSSRADELTDGTTLDPFLPLHISRRWWGCSTGRHGSRRTRLVGLHGATSKNERMRRKKLQAGRRRNLYYWR